MVELENIDLTNTDNAPLPLVREITPRSMKVNLPLLVLIHELVIKKSRIVEIRNVQVFQLNYLFRLDDISEY